MNIKVEYIPKAEDESFYRIMLDKYLTLGLVQYKRVLFLDGDGKFILLASICNIVFCGQLCFPV